MLSSPDTGPIGNPTTVAEERTASSSTEAADGTTSSAEAEEPFANSVRNEADHHLANAWTCLCGSY